jgi:hypothetical protein
MMAAPRFDDLLKEEGAERIAAPSAPRFDDLLKAEGAEPLGPPPPAAPPAPETWTDKAKRFGSAVAETSHDALMGIGQGLTFKHGDELGALGQVGLDLAARTQPRPLLDALGIESRYREPLSAKGVLESYRDARGGNRTLDEAAKKRSPYAFGGSEFAAGMAVPIGGAAKTIGQAAKLGGAMGAVGGSGGSEADLTKGELGRYLFDVNAGGALGVLGGPVAYGIGKAVPYALRGVGNALKGAGTSIGRYVLERGSRKAGYEPLSDEAVREALDSGAIVPFGTTGGAAQRLERAAEDYGNVYGAELQKMQNLGVEGPPLMATRDVIYKRGDQVFRGVSDRNVGAGDTRLRDIYRKKADDLLEMFGDRTGKKLKDLKTRRFVSPDAASLPLTIGENFKRTIGQRAEHGRIEDTLDNETLLDIYRLMKEASEEAVAKGGQKGGPGSEVADLAESFIPTKQKLGRLLEARGAAARGAAKASRESPGPGLKDLGTSAMISPDGGTAVLAAMALRLARERFPSAAASTLRAAGNLPSRLGDAAARRPLQVAEGVRRALSSGQRESTPQLSDEFWEKFAPPEPPPSETEEERRIRELREKLYPY